jgi:hypothetical protein
VTIKFARLQEYLDLIVVKAGDDANNAPHKRFWQTHHSLTAEPLPRPKCKGKDIFAVKYLDAKHTKVDADNSPLYVILTDANGFCEKPQMPPLGPFITDAGYSLTLSDGSIVTGKQVKDDIHEWLAAGAPNDPIPLKPDAARRHR